MKNQQKTKQYIRNQKGHRVGVMVAREKDNHFAIGFSLCATKKGDKFDPQLGEDIALKRAYLVLDEGKEHVVPKSIESQVIDFTEKSFRYFNDNKELVNDNIKLLHKFN